MNPIRLVACMALVCGVLAAGGAAAERPIVVRLYSTIITGVDPGRALGATTPMIHLLEQKLDYPIDFAIVTDGKDAELMKFGKKMSDGDVHIGIMWGIEYGWLVKDYPNLDLLVGTSTQGGEVGWPSQLMVRPEYEGKTIADLKGKKLAVIERAPATDALFLAKEIEDAHLDPNGFFASESVYDTVPEAIRAVEKGNCDCLAINIFMWGRHISTRPAAKKHMTTLATSLTKFPDAVLAGDRVRINRMRPRLWEDIQSELQKMDQEEYGKQCMNFWMLEKFVLPDYKNFREIVRESSAAYPFERALQRAQFAGDGGRERRRGK